MPFPASRAHIEAAEQALGRGLPSAHRRRLESDNGGDILAGGENWSLHPVRDASDRRRLKRSMADIVTETKAAREWPRFPPDGLSVAQNGTGDRVILVPDGAYSRWDHETGQMTPVTIEWSP